MLKYHREVKREVGKLQGVRKVVIIPSKNHATAVIKKEGGGELKYRMASSPSCRYAKRNLLADIKRML